MEGKINLCAVDLNGYVLRNINQREANLEDNNFSYADFTEAD